MVMPRIPTSQLIAETMITRSGTTLLAREVAHTLRTTYNRQTSVKSISKTLLRLEDQYPLLNRRPTTNQEKARYNTRYIYLWGHFNEDLNEDTPNNQN